MTSNFRSHKNRKSQSQYKRSLRVESLEERALLSAVPLSASEYADLRAQYSEFNLPQNMADVNVITLDLSQGDNLTSLKNAISTAGQTTKSDLIVVRTTDSANTITYTAAANELAININASQYGSVTIVGLGSKPFTLNANQKCRVMNISGTSSEVNLGGMTIQNGRVSANNGGGIINKGIMNISNCAISGNTVALVNSEEDSLGGGGIYNLGNISINNSTISNNSVGAAGNPPYGPGGGILNFNIVTITNSTISGNWANWGGGIYNEETNATATVTNCMISGNNAGYGGGAFNHFGYLSIINSTVSNNTTNYRNGGGIDSNGTLYVINSKITGNTATRDGGGIYNASMLVVTNSIIANNISARDGGGIYTKGDSGSITNCTITGNKASYYNGSSVDQGSGGGIKAVGVTLVMSNSIVVSNTARENNDIHISDSTATNGSNNLSSFTGWSGGGNFTYTSTKPLFVNAAKGDYRLAVGSQGIDKGSNMFAGNAGLTENSKDLSGNRRIDGTIDIGAYEFQKNVTYSTVVTTLNDSFDSSDDEWSLREAVYYASIYDSVGYPAITFADNLNGKIDLALGQLEVLSALSIDGAGRITIDGNQKDRVFYVNAGTTEQPVVLNGLTIQNGHKSFSGGGINNNTGVLYLTNCLITNNSANEYGGGIHNHYGTVAVTNSTISGNTASLNGGGISTYYGSYRVNNTIIAGNNSAKDVFIVADNGTISGSNNLSSYTGWKSGSGNLSFDSTKPLFVDAANGDYHLVSGSQAIDKGKNTLAVDANGQALTTDLDNNRRIMNDTVDVGAYEYLPIEVSINGKKVSVTWEDSNPAADTLRYRVAGTAKWTTKKLKAGVTEFSFNGKVGTDYEIEVLLDQNEADVLQSTAVVLDQAKLKADKKEVKDDTFQVNVTNYTAKNLAANAKQAIVTITIGKETQATVVDIVNQQGSAALVGGGFVTFDNGLFTFTNMNSNTQYKVQVAFSDGLSVSTVSSNLSVKTLKAPYLAPVLKSATATSSTTIQVEWETAYGKGTTTPAQYYTVQYSLDGVKWKNVTTKATGTSFTITKLKPGTQYLIAVIATKDQKFNASEPSNSKLVTTMA